MRAAPVLVAVALLAWLGLTALSAVPRVGDLVRARTPAWFAPLVPSWTFFAPRPATSDRVLLYRDLSTTGELGPLREVWPGSARSAGARMDKVVGDAASQLLARANKEGGALGEASTQAAIMMSTPYMMLLGRAAAAPHDARAEGFQFIVARSSLRAEEPDVLFTSAVHRLPEFRPESARHGARPGAPC